ncbi:hypothetical protein L1987_17588 [Smallanthus sonchifolius]|uniref:Uncharacterized protein n=1 Tax=Smallanthus sonchifolius TaxID=185202 RepID=A0ACB9IZC4_9ASTR|nr:hypothetical protein L1987_17588 [Smallanthus sonchifolius]
MEKANSDSESALEAEIDESDVVDWSPDGEKVASRGSSVDGSELLFSGYCVIALIQNEVLLSMASNGQSVRYVRLSQSSQTSNRSIRNTSSLQPFSKLYHDGSEYVVERGDQELIRVFAVNEFKWLTREDSYTLGRIKMLYDLQDQSEVDFWYECIKTFTAN